MYHWIQRYYNGPAPLPPSHPHRFNIVFCPCVNILPLRPTQIAKSPSHTKPPIGCSALAGRIGIAVKQKKIKKRETFFIEDYTHSVALHTSNSLLSRALFFGSTWTVPVPSPSLMALTISPCVEWDPSTASMYRVLGLALATLTTMLVGEGRDSNTLAPIKHHGLPGQVLDVDCRQNVCSVPVNRQACLFPMPGGLEIMRCDCRSGCPTKGSFFVLPWTRSGKCLPQHHI